jgi:hypothetical protein
MIIYLQSSGMTLQASRIDLHVSRNDFQQRFLICTWPGWTCILIFVFSTAIELVCNCHGLLCNCSEMLCNCRGLLSNYNFLFATVPKRFATVRNCLQLSEIVCNYNFLFSTVSDVFATVPKRFATIIFCLQQSAMRLQLFRNDLQLSGITLQL